jgi:hypothetical protein
MSIIDLSVLLGVGGLIILAGIAVVNILQKIKINATPTVQAILDALLPYAQKAIVAGEKLAVEGLDEVDRELDGADKKAIADAVYNTLPDQIYIPVLKRSVPLTLIKSLITREMWADLVKRVFDETDAFIERNRDYLKKQIPPDAPLAKVQGLPLQGYIGVTSAVPPTTFQIPEGEGVG